MSEQFYKRNFPYSKKKRTEVLLNYSSGGEKARVRWMTELYFSIQGASKTILFYETFLLVPRISYNIYLGQTFLSSSGFCCYTPRFIYLNPLGPIVNQLIDTQISESHNTVKATVQYLSRDKYDNLIGEAHDGTRSSTRSPQPTDGFPATPLLPSKKSDHATFILKGRNAVASICCTEIFIDEEPILGCAEVEEVNFYPTTCSVILHEDQSVPERPPSPDQNEYNGKISECE